MSAPTSTPVTASPPPGALIDLFARDPAEPLGSAQCPQCGRFARIVFAATDLDGDVTGAVKCAKDGRVPW